MNKIWLFAVSLSMVLALGSCKPKQSAYQAAYEQAKEKETTSPVVRPAEEVATPVVSADGTRQERIRAAEGENADGLRRYSVVIGSFRNKTNAYSLKERMQGEGYNALLGENEQGMLRVIVSSFDNRADAVASRDAVKAKYAPTFQDAWLLERQY